MTLTLFNQFGIYPSAINATLNGIVFSITTTTPSTNFIIPVAGGVFNALIDWGDGTTTTVTTTGNKSHTYSIVGTYQIQITGTFPVFSNAGNYASAQLITSVDSLTVGMLTSLDHSFWQTRNLTSINTAFDTTGVTSFSYAWNNCRALTSFPLINTSSGTDFSYAWEYCTSLTSFPLIDTSAGTNFTNTWSSTALTSFPLIDTSSGITFFRTWYFSTSLTSFPLIDTSAGTNFSYAWSHTALTSFPLLDTSSGTNFNNAWSSTALTSFPALNLSAGTDFSYTWANCTSLTSFPALNLSAGTNFYQAWANCSSLTSFPSVNVSAGTNFSYTWYNCPSLTSFPANMFDTCTATNFTNAFLNCALSQTSVNNILISIDTAGQSGGTLNINGGTSATPSGAGITAKNNLIAKGWTVTTN